MLSKGHSGEATSDTCEGLFLDRGGFEIDGRNQRHTEGVEFAIDLSLPLALDSLLWVEFPIDSSAKQWGDREGMS